MSKKIFLAPLIIISLLAPQVAFASWWNPFSWTFFKKKSSTNTTIIVSTTTQQSGSQASYRPIKKDAVYYLSTPNPLDVAVEGYDIDREAWPRDVLADDSPPRYDVTQAVMIWHATTDDCWVSQNKRVYDVTFLLSEAKASPSVTRLQKLCGTDITEVVNSSPVEPGSLNTARFRYALSTLVIGRLTDELSDNSNQEKNTTVPAYIASINGDQITLDYFEIYTGVGAKNKMIVDGFCKINEDCNVFPAYYRNINNQLRTFTVAKDVMISDARRRKISFNEFSSYSDVISKLVKDGPYSKDPSFEQRVGLKYMFTFNSKGEVSQIREIFNP